jgi:hypothetical protein
MRHSFADPAFPDIVGEWAEEEFRKSDPSRHANDNGGKKEEDPLMALVARAEVEASRLW